MQPDRYPAGPLIPKEGGSSSRWINRPDTLGWDSLLFAEWELAAASWTDAHEHDEFNYVLAGRLIVEVDGVAVEAIGGDVVRVPAGATGRYSAPEYARMVSIYAPNPTGAKPTNMRYETLTSAQEVQA